MYPRTNYEMTQGDMDTLLSSIKSIPVMFLSGGTPMGRSKQEMANDAWAVLGKKMGFDYMTVQPIPGKGQLFFSAVPSENEAQRNEREAKERHAARLKDIERLKAEISERQAKLAELENV